MKAIENSRSVYVRPRRGARRTDEVAQLFHEAAKVFLFPGLESHARLVATVEEHDGARAIVVHAVVRPEHALVPLDITFGLPLANA